VYPRRCAGCGADASDQTGHLCWNCLAEFPKIVEPMCQQCGDPAEGMIEHEYVCGWCRSNKPRFDLARSAVRFRGPVREAMHALKYGEAVFLAPELAELLAACVAVHYPKVLFDAVVPVPLHPKRERERSYNQSALLAAALGARLGVIVRGRCVRRVRETGTQTHLNAAARRANVRGAFEVSDPQWVAGRRLLLVDDTMTTGATVDECAGALKKAGAASVHVVTLARG